MAQSKGLQNIRALCIFKYETGSFRSHSRKTDEALKSTHQTKESVKLHVNRLISPIFVIIHISVDEETNCPLHLLEIRHMLLYFLVVPHIHIASFSLWNHTETIVLLGL